MPALAPALKPEPDVEGEEEADGEVVGFVDDAGNAGWAVVFLGLSGLLCVSKTNHELPSITNYLSRTCTAPFAMSTSGVVTFASLI
jgi:hypothetical protein